MGKRILLPTPDYVPQRGGVARYLFTLKQMMQDDLEILYWPKEMPRGWALFSAIRKAQKSMQAEEIWTSHIFPIGTMLLAMRIIFKTPYVVFLHGMDFDLARRSGWRRFLAKQILKKARRVVTNTQALAKEVADFSGRQAEVLYPTLPEWTEEVDFFCAENKEGVQLLTVGRLVERKGYARVLKALAQLPVEVQYVMIGDGEEKSHIEELVAEYSLESRVQIRTGVEDTELAEWYRRSDIFVMPTVSTSTDREGFGIVYLEAQYMGLPVIASRLPGIDEAVKHGEGGMLVETDAELQEALQQLIRYAELRQNLGEMGRKRVSSLFSMDAQKNALKRIYE